MGKKKEKHNQKVRERNRRIGIGLDNPIARKVVAVSARGKVIGELQAASTEDQIDALSRTVATAKPSKLRDAIMKKAPGEMDKAIRKFQAEGKPVTVESLTEEAKNMPSFVRMCRDVGLEMIWFEDLARKRMEVNGI